LVFHSSIKCIMFHSLRAFVCVRVCILLGKEKDV